ncbi:hypothetical protein FRC04_005745 [Tulasnella sp. 424]|nr:hypothetical protein FRC04_005745 [Tulasnella sp. 424]
MPSRSPIPRPPSSAQAQRHNRLRHDTVSGSETERDQRRDSMSDEHSTPPQSAGIQSRFDDAYPPADEDYEAEAERGGPSRTLRRSLNGTVSRRRGLDPDSPLFSGAIHAAINDPPTSVRTSPHRTRNPLPQEFRDRPNYNGYDQDREPSPEARYRASSRERTTDYPPSPTGNRPQSRAEYGARPPSVLGNGRMTGRPSSRASNYVPPSAAMTPSNSGMTTSSSNRSSAGRFATVRERATPSHYRWASEDVHSPDDYPGDRSRGDVSHNDSRGDGEHPPRWRYQSRGGSAESALGHRLVGEGLRAAGLTKRRESSPPRRGEDIFNDRNGREDKGKDREPFPKIESSGSSSAVSVITTRSQESEMRRERLSRLPGMERVASADPRTPYGRESSRGPPVTASRTGSSGGPPRPATSIDPGYYDSQNQPRTAPPPLRSYRSYAATDRDRVPPSASRTSYASPVALRPYDEERDEKERLSLPPKPGSALRRLNTASPAPDHARLLQEAFRAFEGNVRRAGPTIHPNAASGCVNAADTLVKAASILNSLLRSNADRAMEELVEAEVDDDGRGGPGEAELWRRIGAEFRESAKVSDEIIRTMTAFLLDVGRVMRDAASATATATSSGRGTPPASSSAAVFPSSSSGLHHAGSNGHLRTMSLDEEALAARRAENNSADGRSSLAGSGSGFSAGARARQSVDGGSVSSSSRRSIDRGGGSGSGRLSSEFGEIGSRDSRRSLDGRDSGSLRRLASRRTESGQFDQPRPPPSAFDHQRLTAYDQQRASTSMSVSRSAGTQNSDRERREYDSPLARDDSMDDRPDPTPSKPPKASVLSALSNRRLFPSRRPQTSPANAKPPPLARTNTDVTTPTTQVRNGISPRVGDEERRRRFPSLAIPPPLSTLPSESHMERRLTPRSASGQGIDPSRKKTSTGSTATVTMRAGGARFPSLTSPSKPTTQVTPTTVSTASDREFEGRPVNRSSQQQPPDRSYHHDSLGTRASNAATISGATSRQFAGERDQRQRTMSTLSSSDMPIREDSGEYEEFLASSTTSTIVGRRNQDARPESGHYATTRGSDRDRHNRRRTVGEIFR